MTGATAAQPSMPRKVYIPPEFEPCHRPNIFTPPEDQGQGDGGFRANTSNISPYHTVTETESMYNTEFVGQSTGAFASGERRNTFARSYVPPGVDSAAVIQEPPAQIDDSIALLGDQNKPSAMHQQPETARVSDTVQQGTQQYGGLTSFRGPDIILHNSSQYGVMDDTDVPVCESATAPGFLEAKQPTWPPAFMHQEVQKREVEQPINTQNLGVYSVHSSGESMQSNDHSPAALIPEGDLTYRSEASQGHGPAMSGGGACPKSKRSAFRKLFACFS